MITLPDIVLIFPLFVLFFFNEIVVITSFCWPSRNVLCILDLPSKLQHFCSAKSLPHKSSNHLHYTLHPLVQRVKSWHWKNPKKTDRKGFCEWSIVKWSLNISSIILVLSVSIWAYRHRLCILYLSFITLFSFFFCESQGVELVKVRQETD